MWKEESLKWVDGNWELDTNRDRLNLDMIHDFLSNVAYWSLGIDRARVEKGIEGAVSFGLYHKNHQVGFARVITDGASFGYLADVFILPEHRGLGRAKWMMQFILDHPDLQGLRRWMLATGDAHGLYAQYGFKPLQRPEVFMERHSPRVYTEKGQA